MIFRKAEWTDVDAVERVYEAYLAYAQTHTAWTVWRSGVYPTKETAETAVETGALYVLEEQGEVIASVILNHVQAPEYRAVPWICQAADSEVLVIHTLCVSPAHGGKGIGRAMVRHSIEEAARLDCRVIRLDTGGQNKPAIGLYQSMGFTLTSAGTILLDGQIPHEGHVFMEYAVK